jgi:hypothetical protein
LDDTFEILHLQIHSVIPDLPPEKQFLSLTGKSVLPANVEVFSTTCLLRYIIILNDSSSNLLHGSLNHFLSGLR